MTPEDAEAFIGLRIRQLIEEGAREDCDLRPALRDYYARHLADGTFVAWLALEGGEIVGTGGMSFVEIRRLNDTRREAFAAALADIGARVCPSDANFLLCDFGRDMRPDIERLREMGLLVRPCGMFPGLTHGHVRLCVRTEGENVRLVEAMK